MQLTEETFRPLTQDPVCGRHITEAQALLCAEHHGRTCLFCSERCRMLFALRTDLVRSGYSPAGNGRGARAMRRRHCAPHVRLAPCLEGSACNDLLYRRGSIGVRQKTVARASEGASSSSARIFAGVAARVARRGRGRTVEE